MSAFETSDAQYAQIVASVTVDPDRIMTVDPDRIMTVDPVRFVTVDSDTSVVRGAAGAP